MALTVAGGSSGYSSSITVEEDPQAADRYARDAAWEANRDDWGRPKVRCEDGSDRGFRRASGFGSPLESDFALRRWLDRKLVEGLLLDRGPLRMRFSRELARAVAAEEAGVRDEVKAANDEMAVICEEARKLAGTADKADIGTALHDICERYDRGLPLGHVGDEWLPDVAAWQELIADFEVLSIERIVVNHEFEIGGKLDRVVRLRRPFVVRKAKRKYTNRSTNTHRPARPAIVLPAGTVVLADQKTSQDMGFAGAKFACQCYAYATGVPYNPITESDEPWGHDAPNPDWAAILHTPSGQGRGSIHWVDLRGAYQATVDADTCYKWRNRWGKALIESTCGDKCELSCAKDHDREVLEAWFREAATAATTLGELRELHRQAVACGCWADRLREVFTRTREEIEMRTEQSATEAVSA